MTMDRQQPTYWLETASIPRFAPLSEDIQADVVIVGGGITGLTAAYQLLKAGRSVVLLDARRLGRGESGHTTAHLTHVVDTRLQTLVERVGVDGARAVWDSSRSAIEFIRRFNALEHANADVADVPGLLVATRKEDLSTLDKEEELARTIGYRPTRLEAGALPIKGLAGLRFDRQARFHLGRYLARMVEVISGLGGRLFEETPVKEVESGDPTKIKTDAGRTVTASAVIVAAHVPFQNWVLIHDKQAAYRSYAIGVRVPKGKVTDELVWDLLDPYHYIRLQPDSDHDLLIVGGEDHKTGTASHTDEAFDRLREWTREQYGVDDVAWTWSGQIMETTDGLPYIGNNIAGKPNEWLATGYLGNGMTYGTLAGMMLAERVLGRTTPWDSLYDPHRLKGGLWKYVSENATVPYYLVKDRLFGLDAGDASDGRELKPGEGQVVKASGQKVALCRDEHGGWHAVDPVCPHMGCDVNWNSAERTWDCPCHGSRFSMDGDLINGPAVSPLTKRPTPSLRE